MLLPTTSMILLPFKTPRAGLVESNTLQVAPQATEPDIQPDFNIGQLFGDFVYPFWGEREIEKNAVVDQITGSQLCRFI